MIYFSAVILLVMTFFITDFSVAKNKCMGNAELAGRKEMIDALKSKNYEQFDQLFQKLCADHASLINCKVETAMKEEAKQNARDLVKGHPCAEVHHVAPKGMKETKLYFIDTN